MACRIVGTAAASASPQLEAGELGDQPAVVVDAGVPVLEARFELLELVSAALETHRLAGVRGDPVLVPRDVPRDRDRHLSGVAGERDDAGARLAEALRDAADRAPVAARVEQMGGLEQSGIAHRRAARDRLGRRNRLLRAGAGQAEELAEPAAAPLARSRNRGRRRRPLLDPAVLEGGVLAERTDVDELRAVLRRVADRPLSHQQRPLADRADSGRADLGDVHESTIAPTDSGFAQRSPRLLLSLTCVFYI